MMLFALMQGCVSKGPYFKISQLDDMVRDRFHHNRVIHQYGPTKARFADNVFSQIEYKPSSTERLLIQEIDGIIFSAVEGEVEQDYNSMEFAPGEQPRMARIEKKSNDNSGFFNHSSDTIEFNDCQENPRQVIRYLSVREDFNGYSERQYAALFLNRQLCVCGYRVRSLFFKG